MIEETNRLLDNFAHLLPLETNVTPDHRPSRKRVSFRSPHRNNLTFFMCIKLLIYQCIE